MFDAKIRPFIDPPLNLAARALVAAGATPNRVTATGFGFTLLNFASLAFAQYSLALTFIGLSRLMDGLDGAVARQIKITEQDGRAHTGESDLGAFLDIVSDFIFYSGTVFFFAVGQPQFGLWAAFLIFCFMGTGSSFLAYAIIAAKHGINHQEQGKKSFFYLSGITEGSETILFLILICIFPDHFPYLSAVFGFLCLLTAAGRVRQGIADFKV